MHLARVDIERFAGFICCRWPAVVVERQSALCHVHDGRSRMGMSTLSSPNWNRDGDEHVLIAGNRDILLKQHFSLDRRLLGAHRADRKSDKQRQRDGHQYDYFLWHRSLIGKSKGRQGTTKDTNVAKKGNDRRAFCAPCGRISLLQTRSEWKCPEYPTNRFDNAESFLDGSP